jgi:hypothetical protein
VTTATDFKKLPPTFITHRAEFDYATYFLKLPAQYTYADLFHPEFWDFHQKKLQRCDLVRVVSESEKFDVMLTVTGKSFGVQVKLYAGHPPAPASAVKAA